jgi:hypothetical protein
VVDLHRNRIATLPAPKLATLTGITKLRLSGNVVTALDEFWNSLASLPALTTLCLEDNEIAALPTIEPGHFVKLETLSLGIVGQRSGESSGFARVVCSAGQDRRSAQHDRVHPGRVRGNATAEVAAVGRQQGR